MNRTEEIRAIAREEAQKVLEEYLAARRKRREAAAEREQRNHDQAMAEVMGPHGQG